jgi:phenylpropionate dioxygenase-like ring-hydroxylating dioxygenase large terminal subunit
MRDSNEAADAIERLRVTDPERVPVQRYFDRGFYQAELDRLWPHVWQMSCRLEQIPAVGDWIEYSSLGQSVIVVHTAAGIKAFHNACRHRGVPLVDEDTHGNCGALGLVCRFHGWRYGMDGENNLVPGCDLLSSRQLEPAEIALRPCRVETWGGCAFINHDDETPDLRSCLGPVAERLEAHGLGDLRAEWWYSTRLPANWKTAVEAFLEGYHVMATHPQLYRAMPGLFDGWYGAPRAMPRAAARAGGRAI